MNRLWIFQFRYRILALVLFFVTLSLLSIDGLMFGEEDFREKAESIQIINHWPNKTALQVEESLTKPWEQILRSISGYKQIESISEVGSSMILLELQTGIQKQDIIKSIRNEYLLQRQRFPKDSLFPQIKSTKSEESYILILQRTRKGSDATRKELEQKIRTLKGVLSFVHHEYLEKEVILQIEPDLIQTTELPSLSQIFSAIRNHSFGFSLDGLYGHWFQKDFPIHPKDWSQVGIPSFLGEGLKISSLGVVSLREREVRHGTRINGISSETIMIKADSSTSLYSITKELNSILSINKDWTLLYSSHEDFINDLFRWIWLFFFVDLVLIFFALFSKKTGKETINDLLSYYVALLLFLGFANLINYPIGRSILFFCLVWKYLLVVCSIRKIQQWFWSMVPSYCVFYVFVFWNWIPMSFAILSLCHIYFLLSFFFLKILMNSFLSFSIPSIGFDFIRFLSFFKKKQEVSQSQGSIWGKILVFGFFMLGVTTALVSSFRWYSLHSSQGSIQMGKLEFPTSISEQESIRITKQVEDSILKRNLTELLVVKQNTSSADFYFRWNEFGLKTGIQNLPTESGYFHILGGSETNTNQTIRFSNANTETLEKTILGLIPLLHHKPGVEEVVLCFQPSTEGLSSHSPTMFQNLIGFNREESLHERALGLQSAIVGKMVLENRLTDVRFVVKQKKEMERYAEEPTKLNSGTSLYSQSFTDYQKIKIPGRIYRKNGETSLEILVKGKEIEWVELKSKIQKFLQNDVVKLSEMIPSLDLKNQYRPIFLFLVFAIFLYRKKDKMGWILHLFCFLFLWRLNVSVFGDDYLLFGSVTTLLLFFVLWIPRKTISLEKQIPFCILLFVSYFLPGDGGRFFMNGLFLIFSFFLIQSQIFQKWKIFKTKHLF
ncbi:efflux RND transporter permease subunit [Leptospira sp. 201903075]|uniref:efflux RND transporter permease subunit n=1 Tax=Leptospira chreensis TaxID=2810035 RepID=UPI0019664689|nr:efflux RND transporter permease subunit [Leptospira chreensis]MBM9590040.1 efflux RND transporter permease subunit [Leptospira chreensis]